MLAPGLSHKKAKARGSASKTTTRRTFKNMQVLTVKVVGVASGEVDVPGAVEVVYLGSPDIRAARGVGARVDDLLRSRRETRDSGRAGNLDVRPRRRHDIIVATAVGHERVGTAGAADRVRERRSEAHHRCQAPEHSSQAHLRQRFCVGEDLIEGIVRR